MKSKSAFDAGAAAQPEWNQSGGDARAAVWKKRRICWRRSARISIDLLVREAGKTFSDAIAEVREAVDFCRYYALRARKQFAAPAQPRGPHRRIERTLLQGRGVFACISPGISRWRFLRAR